MTVKMRPSLIIHGGAGRAMRDAARLPAIREALHEVAHATFAELDAGISAVDAVRAACRALEDKPDFNAGTGACLQADGSVRLSASLMDGPTQSFSGVINARNVRNPIELASALQASPDRVLAGDGVDLLCRELGVPPWDNLTERRLAEWVAERRQDRTREMASVTADDDHLRSGTIGAVALDTNGNVAAATSTGGRGFERVGRVSDSATPAGNFANAMAGASATGVGEHILDEGLAVAIVVRRTDGMSLHDAVLRSMRDGISRNRRYGIITLDSTGDIVWGKTTDILLAAYADHTGVVDTLDEREGIAVGGRFVIARDP